MTQNLIKKFKTLKLKTCCEHFESIQKEQEDKNLSFPQALERLIDLEIETRQINRIALRYKQSKLTDKLTIDQFDFDHHESRKNNKNRYLNLLSMKFIEERKDIILIGNPGVGKSFMAKCIAYAATQAEIKVLFTTTMDMINHLIAAEADRSLLKKLHYYKSPDLLVCDEIGYLSLGKQGSNLFFQVISERNEKKSTIVTTNRMFSEWGEVFDSTMVATAIADRLVHNSEIFIMEGPSYRKKAMK